MNKQLTSQTDGEQLASKEELFWDMVWTLCYDHHIYTVPVEFRVLKTQWILEFWKHTCIIYWSHTSHKQTSVCALIHVYKHSHTHTCLQSQTHTQTCAHTHSPSHWHANLPKHVRNACDVFCLFMLSLLYLMGVFFIEAMVFCHFWRMGCLCSTSRNRNQWMFARIVLIVWGMSAMCCSMSS